MYLLDFNGAVETKRVKDKFINGCTDFSAKVKTRPAMLMIMNMENFRTNPTWTVKKQLQPEHDQQQVIRAVCAEERYSLRHSVDSPNQLVCTRM